MRNLSNLLFTSAVIGLVGLSGLGKADAQGTQPTKKQCVEQLSSTMSKKQKVELAKIDKEPEASREQKLEQFILSLNPNQRKAFDSCMKASKK